jgi:hypothetical protein
MEIGGLLGSRLLYSKLALVVCIESEHIARSLSYREILERKSGRDISNVINGLQWAGALGYSIAARTAADSQLHTHQFASEDRRAPSAIASQSQKLSQIREMILFV